MQEVDKGGGMDKKDRLHIEASAYAKTVIDELRSRRSDCNLDDLDVLTQGRIWVSAYEGYKAGYKAAQS